MKYTEEQEDVEYVHQKNIHTTASGKAYATFRVFGRLEGIQFPIDTGASCNVIPFKDCVRAAGDKEGQKLDKTHTILVFHNNTHVKSKGATRNTLNAMNTHPEFDVL